MGRLVLNAQAAQSALKQRVFVEMGSTRFLGICSSRSYKEFMRHGHKLVISVSLSPIGL